MADDLSIERTARSMAGLAPKRGRAHPWWALAEAMVDLLESDNEEAIELVTKTFERRAQ